jgi:hypothetical protein
MIPLAKEAIHSFAQSHNALSGDFFSDEKLPYMKEIHAVKNELNLLYART